MGPPDCLDIAQGPIPNSPQSLRRLRALSLVPLWPIFSAAVRDREQVWGSPGLCTLQLPDQGVRLASPSLSRCPAARNKHPLLRKARRGCSSLAMSLLDPFRMLFLSETRPKLGAISVAY